jgi:hypothetical protein
MDHPGTGQCRSTRCEVHRQRAGTGGGESYSSSRIAPKPSEYIFLRQRPAWWLAATVAYVPTFQQVHGAHMVRKASCGSSENSGFLMPPTFSCSPLSLAPCPIFQFCFHLVMSSILPLGLCGNPFSPIGGCTMSKLLVRRSGLPMSHEP